MRKKQDNEIIFRIDAFTPETLPMARLAEYMAELAALYGSENHVHFVRVGRGSTNLVQKVDAHATPEVRHRLRLVSAKNAPTEAMQTYQKLNGMLIHDNAIADIKLGGGKILGFPGRKTPAVETIGPVKQQDFLDGELIRIGGKDDTIPVHIRDEGTITICTTNLEIARKLGPHLYGAPIRVFGTATWIRQPSADWELDKFQIDSFIPLEDKSLAQAIEELSAIPADWPDNALTELAELRKTNAKNGRH